MKKVVIEATDDLAGQRAAQVAGAAIAAAITQRGKARVIFASAPSQATMLEHLSAYPGIDWQKVESFHMDEYMGLDMAAPQAFGTWLLDRLPKAAAAGFDRIRTDAPAAQEIARYTAALQAEPIDVTCLGVGMNGHIAFNEPGDTDFADPRWVREVRLDETSRRQQVEEGLFATLDDVPTTAISLTVPALLAGRIMVCTVLGEHKAAAVTRALTGEVSTDCPASILTQHDGAQWFLDAEAAAGLSS